MHHQLQSHGLLVTVSLISLLLAYSSIAQQSELTLIVQLIALHGLPTHVFCSDCTAGSLTLWHCRQDQLHLQGLGL